MDNHELQKLKELEVLKAHENFPVETFSTFQTGKIDIPIYGVDIELPENCFFRNDKTVESILAHTEKVLKEFKLDPIILAETEIKDLQNTTGHNRNFELKDNKGNIVARFAVSYILPENDRRGPEFQTFNEAHEIAHAIHSLDEASFNAFIENTLRKVGIKINTAGLDDETQCRIMGLIALKLHNIPMNVFNQHLEFKEAYELVQELVTKYPESYRPNK